MSETLQAHSKVVRWRGGSWSREWVGQRESLSERSGGEIEGEDFSFASQSSVRVSAPTSAPSRKAGTDVTRKAQSPSLIRLATDDRAWPCVLAFAPRHSRSRK